MPNVDIPGVGVTAFPDSMSQQDIAAASKRLYEQAQAGTPAVAGGPTRANLVGSLAAIPGRLAEFATAGFQGPTSPGAVALARRTTEDLIRAREGDQGAANRVAGREMAAGLGTAVLPGGPLAGGLRALVARGALGATSSAAEAAAAGRGGEDIGRAALTGGTTAAVLPPILAAPLRAIGRPVAAMMQPEVQAALRKELLPILFGERGLAAQRVAEAVKAARAAAPVAEETAQAAQVPAVDALEAWQAARAARRAEEAAAGTGRVPVGTVPPPAPGTFGGQPAPPPSVTLPPEIIPVRARSARGASTPELGRRTSARARATGKTPPASVAAGPAFVKQLEMEDRLNRLGLNEEQKGLIRRLVARGQNLEAILREAGIQ